MSDVALQKHYSVAEVSAMWGVSKDTVRRVFSDQPGVLRITHTTNKKRNARRYVTLRIPEGIVTLLHATLAAKRGKQ
jgi:hypothetical protein